MAEQKRKKLPAYTSPKGTFRFPKLSEVDYGTDKYKKPDGEYSVQLVFEKDSPEAQALIAKLTPHLKEAEAEAAEKFKALSVKARKEFEKKANPITGPQMNSLYQTLYDKETEEETGEIAFKFAMRASGIRKHGAKKGTKWTRFPDIFDAKGRLISKDHKGKPVKFPDIWGGTVGKVSYEVSTYFVEGTAAAGVKLNLSAVQIIDLVSAGGRSAESHGFAEEDGYEHEEEPAERTFQDTADDTDEIDTGNF